MLSKFQGNTLSRSENTAKSFRGLLFLTHTVHTKKSRLHYNKQTSCHILREYTEDEDNDDDIVTITIITLTN